MNNYYWQLPDSRIWGRAEGGWVAKEAMMPGGALSLVDGVDQLRERVKLYDGALGELATPEDIREASRPGPEYEWDEAGEGWVKMRFSKLAFFNLFTMAEKVIFKTVIANGNMVAGVIHDSLIMADFIDLADPSTVEALYGLASEAGGLVITQERAAEILAGEPYVAG